MQQPPTFDVVKAILVEDLGMVAEQVKPETHLQEDLELDSTDTIELSLQLKQRLGVSVQVQIRDDPTIGDICDQVDRARTDEQTHSSSPS